MRRPATIAVVVALGVVMGMVGAASARTVAAPTGTWAGPVSWFAVYGPGERYERARLRLTLKGQGAALVATGRSGASHDAPSATASCTSTFRLAETADGWLVYVQSARGSSTGAGGVQNGPCTGPLGALRGALRVRPAGRRITAEVGLRLRDEPPRWEFRATLTRA